MNNKKIEKRASIFSNLASEKVFVDVNQENTSLKVYNALGEKMYEEKTISKVKAASNGFHLKMSFPGHGLNGRISIAAYVEEIMPNSCRFIEGDKRFTIKKFKDTIKVPSKIRYLTR